MAAHPDPSLRPALVLAGLLCVAFAVVFNEFTLSWLDFRPARAVGTETAIRTRQAILLVVGLGLVLAASRAGPARPSRGARVVLLCVGLLGPPALLEFALRPVADLHRKPTTIFMRDEALGWRLRPGVVDDWAGVTVRINAKGLRGPELPYARESDALRILYLGDSVTFGFRLPEAEHAYPYAVQRHVEAATGRRVETVNSGVGGWSPWQQLVWLRQEGVRYAPDLVVVGFVLNDVTEKLGLRRFGGAGVGLQLALSRHSTLDSLSDRLALFQVATRLGARLRYGNEAKGGASRAQLLQVESLVREPEDPAVQAAWDLTLESLDGIFSACAERGIPVLLVQFPFAFQLEERDRLSAPQHTLRAHARSRGVGYLDLLPELVREDFLSDGNHLSVSGSDRVGRLVADWILEHQGDSIGR